MYAAGGGGGYDAGGYPGGMYDMGGGGGGGGYGGYGDGQGYIPGSGGMITPQEQVYYEQLFGMADVERKGYIDANAGRVFLEHSRLSQQQLRTIWEIADVNQQGALDVNRFYVALRLVAHAQSNPGQPLTQELEMVPPPILPEFEGLQRRRDPSEYSPPGSATPSVIGGAVSDISELQPVIGGGEAEVRRAADYARQASRSQSPFSSRAGGRSGWSWTPSRKEKGKYASLFLRADLNRDSFVDGNESRELLQRSGLDDNTLAIAWELAAQGQGMLSFPSFVALIHLISCVKRGAPMPQLHDGLPVELQNACRALEYENPHEIARSRSRSRSPSPGPATLSSQPFPSGEETLPMPSSGGFGGDAGGFGFGAEPAALGDAGDMGEWGAFDGGDKKKGKKKKPKISSELDFGGGEPDIGGGFGSSSAAWGAEPAEAGGGFDQQTGLDLDMGFGTSSHTKHHSRHHSRDPYDSASLSSQFEAVVEADRALTRHLRQEVDSLEGELHQSHQMRDQLERQVRQEQEESERLVEQRKQLERQIQARKQRLAELREERRTVNLESISLRRDREHYAEELAFLQRMVSEEERTLDSVRRSNQFLEKSFKGLEAHTQQLGWQRKEILSQFAKEKEAIKLEEKQNAELRNKLERMRREQFASTANRQKEQRRELVMREMQNEALASR